MFIVERSLAATTVEMAVEGQRRLCEAARRVSDHRHDVTYLRSLTVPARNVCFDVFEATTFEVVKAANDVAQIPYRWIALVHERVGGGAGCLPDGHEAQIPPDPRSGPGTDDMEKNTWTPPSTDGHDEACGFCRSMAC